MSPQPLVIKFFAPVVEQSANALMSVIDDAVNKGTKEIILLISTPGGTVFHGLSIYNYLKGLPIEKLTTHNFGSVDSIGVVIYCAGQERYSSPQARFLIHGVSANIEQKTSLEEPQLEERLKGLRIDIENIAKVISANTGKKTEEVTKAMLERTTLNPEQAKEWGLVHQIRSELFPVGSQVMSILSQQK
jgi:ATP-dependent Clp protease protease subunit